VGTDVIGIGPRRLTQRVAWSVGALLLVGAAALVPAPAQQPAPAAIPVGVVKAEKTAITRTLKFVGRIVAVNRVEVRARVTGYLEAVLFREGDRIQKGGPLYRIEHGLFEAAVEQAEGALERAKSSRALTKIQLDRAQDLMEKQAGTVVARDQAKAADDQAIGAIMEAEANLKTARINLGYTDITSPIDGEVGKTNITIGNVVGPQSGVLTVIVSRDPMYVTFPVSDRDFLRAREAGRQIGYENFSDFKVRIRFADGSTYDQVGKVNFVDVTVDRTTDTVLVRATMPNPKNALTDGQLVTVEVDIGAPQQKVVVPQAALIADQRGVYVFVVENGKAAIKYVKTGGEEGAGIVIEEGLVGGELVIVQGLQGVRPGAPVQASPVEPSITRG
jgi:membrane fusion protein (multidrug efflux system)